MNKQTGAVSWQVYAFVVYGGSGWEFYESVNYQTDHGVTQAMLQPIDRSVSCAAYVGCTYIEQVAFELSDERARAIASLYVPGGPLAAWRFRLKGKAGGEFTDAIATAEFAGLVQKIDIWRSPHIGIKTAPPLSSASPPVSDDH